MSSGALRERVIALHEQKTDDELGGQLVTWPPVFTTWAKVVPITGKESVESAQIQSTLRYRVTIRYRDNVTEAMRLQWGEKILNIISVANVDLHRKYLEIICEAGAV